MSRSTPATAQWSERAEAAVRVQSAAVVADGAGGYRLSITGTPARQFVADGAGGYRLGPASARADLAFMRFGEGGYSARTRE